MPWPSVLYPYSCTVGYSKVRLLPQSGWGLREGYSLAWCLSLRSLQLHCRLQEGSTAAAVGWGLWEGYGLAWCLSLRSLQLHCRLQ